MAQTDSEGVAMANTIREKKRLLIFAQYYAPDIVSTSQLLKDLAEGLLDDFAVTVICVVPSSGGTIDGAYKTQRFYYEELNGVKIIRVRVPEFVKSNKMSRVKNILAYFFGALGACRKAGKQDYVFAISQPPVLGGLLGVLGKWQKHAKLIYCIQDFNPEQIMAVRYSSNKLVLKAMMLLDKFSCRRSDLVITVGRDLVQTLKERFKGKRVPKYAMINNWINEKEVRPLPPDHESVLAFKNQYGLAGKFVIMYSGNIGLYYDLQNLMKVIENFGPETVTSDGRPVVFAFVGAGAVLDQLERYKSEHHMENVVFIPFQPKEALVYSLNAGDVHWCVNAVGLKGVSCPSKYYGLAAAARPVLGVLEKGSEIRCLLEQTRGGLVCDPSDYRQIEENIRWFISNANSAELADMGKRSYAYLHEDLSMEKSIRKYKEEILRL